MNKITIKDALGTIKTARKLFDSKLISCSTRNAMEKDSRVLIAKVKVQREEARKVARQRTSLRRTRERSEQTSGKTRRGLRVIHKPKGFNSLGVAITRSIEKQQADLLLEQRREQAMYAAHIGQG